MICPPVGYQPRLPQLLVEALEQLVDQAVARQLLTKQPQRLGIRDCIFGRQSQKALERQPVADLELWLVV